VAEDFAGQFDKPIQISVTSETENIARLRTAVREAAQQVGFGETSVTEITLAIDEAVTNVIRHGYDGKPGRPIELTIELLDHQGRKGLQFVINDCGRHVDPDTIAGRDLDDVRPGGLGTHILRTVMDEVEYSKREPVGMCLRLVKMLEPSGVNTCGPDPVGREEPADG